MWFCYFPIWYPVTGLVLDCIDIWSLLSFLLIFEDDLVLYLWGPYKQFGTHEKLCWGTRYPKLAPGLLSKYTLYWVLVPSYPTHHLRHALWLYQKKCFIYAGSTFYVIKYLKIIWKLHFCINFHHMHDSVLTLKAPRKKCIWKCRLLKSSAANNCLTLLPNWV